MKVFEEKQRKEQERVARFGQIRPQMSVVHQGQRLVVVRNRFYHSDKWKFFPDFLRDTCLRFLASNGAKQKQRNQKQSAIQL